MHEQYHTFCQLPKNHDLSLYEFLSKIMNSSSQILNLCLRILHFHQQSQIVAKKKAIQQLQQILQLSQGINDQWNTTSNTKNNINLQKRFVCRIIQLILPYKQKAYKYEYLKPLLGLIQQLQMVINNYQKQQDIKQFFLQMFHYFNIFYRFAKKLDQELIIDTPLKQEATKFISETDKQGFSNKNSLKLSTTSQQFQSTKRLKKILTSLNSRYRTISCLDLDAGYYRSSFFHAQNDYKDFYTECMQRNFMIKSQINSYAKQFKQYQNKRQKKKFHKKLSFREKVQIPSMKKTEKVNKSMHIPIRTVFQPLFKGQIKEGNIKNILSQKKKTQPPKRFSLVEETEFSKNEKIYSHTNKKNYYHMKNIVINANKMKMQPLNKPKFQSQIKNSCEIYKSLGKKKDTWLKNWKQLNRQQYQISK